MAVYILKFRLDTTQSKSVKTSGHMHLYLIIRTQISLRVNSIILILNAFKQRPIS